MTTKLMQSAKLKLVATSAMLLVSLLNIQTAYGYITPEGDSFRVTPRVPREYAPRPIPRPGTPRPEYPRPIPIPYPGPNYPGPIYPIYPIPPMPPVSYTEYKTAHINRWVDNETLYVGQLLNFNYNYRYNGYRLKSVRVDISGDSSASLNLVVNGQVVDSRYSHGQDIYLYPAYYSDDLNSEVRSIAIHVNGFAYIYNIVFELERRY